MIDYLLTNLWALWACVSVLCLLLELTSGDCFLLCIAIATALTAICAAFGVGLYTQLVIACIAALICLAAIRPRLVRWLHKGEDKRVSNADAILGRTAVVSQDIPTGGYGRVALDGDDWKALSNDGSPIHKGEQVRILKRDSIIITVEKI